MVRVMRFFPFFRVVVRRSAEVLPALTGPLTLVMTTLHVFVYIGMALWGGAIEVGKLGEEITPLYDLNNFNTYLVRQLSQNMHAMNKLPSTVSKPGCCQLLAFRKVWLQCFRFWL